MAYQGMDTGTGKQKQVHRQGFKTKRAAQDAAKLIEAEAVANNRLSNSKANMTLGEYLIYWIDNLKVNVKVDTIQIHRRNIRFYINPRIGDYQLKDYSFNVHQKFINNLFTEEGAGRPKHGYGWNTVQSINQTLSNALEKAVRLDYIKVNPTRHVEFNRKYRPEVRKMRYFTKEQTDKFLKAAQLEHLSLWYPFFLLMFDCGLRVGENLALRWSRVDFKHRMISIDTIRIYNSEVKVNDIGLKDMMLDTPKTTKSIRKIPLTDRAYDALLDLFKQTHPNEIIKLNRSDIDLNDFIFIKPTGKFHGYLLAITSAQVAMPRICDCAGIPRLNVHGCRHTYGVRLREAGVDINDIQDLMGHVDSETTKLYAEITPKLRKTQLKN